MSEKVHLHERLLTGATTDETKSSVLGPAMVGQCRQLTFYIDWGSTVTAGKVDIETAPAEDYAGAWAQIGTKTYSAGAPLAQYIQALGPFAFVRARVDTATDGNGVSVSVIGN